MTAAEGACSQRATQCRRPSSLCEETLYILYQRRLDISGDSPLTGLQRRPKQKPIPVSPTAPLLHLRELSSGRDNPRLLSRSIELFEIGDDIVNLLRIFQAWKKHFGAGYLGLRIPDVFAESGLVPGDSGILVRGRIAVAFNHPGLSPEDPVEHRANCVLCVLPDLVTRLALDENLLARSRVLGISRDYGEDAGSEHENQTAHPTISMADKEYARANRSDYLPIREHILVPASPVS